MAVPAVAERRLLTIPVTPLAEARWPNNFRKEYFLPRLPGC